MSDDNLSRQREISREERKLKAIKQKVSLLTRGAKLISSYFTLPLCFHRVGALFTLACITVVLKGDLRLSLAVIFSLFP